MGDIMSEKPWPVTQYRFPELKQKDKNRIEISREVFEALTKKIFERSFEDKWWEK